MKIEDLLFTHFSTAGTALTLAGAIVVSFSWANKTISSDLRESVSLWLLGVPGEARLSFVMFEIVKSLFGEKLLSKRAVKALMISEVILIFTILIWNTRTKATGLFALTLDEQLTFLFFMVMFTAPIQLLGYMKSRWIFNRVNMSMGACRLTALLILDIVSQAIIFVAVFFLLPAALSILWNLPTFSKYLIRGELEIMIQALIIIFFVALPPTLISLVAGASLFLRRTYVSITRYSGFLSRYVSQERIEKEPLKIIGEVIAAVVFLGTCALGLR